ncbi:hypothetical protein K227x_44630 [Rubripirellula lacrimiformis]|uniref:TIGR02453 family protein n=1 Tax=Rubripirellula lacrimiformis TaxID=1930273 RepID=A0A517NFX6_9BACT|nr:DUF2461 domain-containing protein [Rubripirellula lacrimiformis]QDT06056.1 hypothetical protein K227x_44630 [Rubripirellula lacrimiformis]
MTDPILSAKLFKFLRALRRNNNREWFNENKPRYEQDVRQPAIELVRRLEKPLASAAPMLGVIAKGHGGSVMRIYRDTRFSKDKTPYKVNVGISIRHQADSNIHSPGIYLNLAPGDCFLGAGLWQPPSNQLAAIRAAIDESPKDWIRARDQKRFRESFTLVGSSLKTAPRDYPKDHPMIEDLRRKDFMGVAPLTEEQMTGPDAVAAIIDKIKNAKPWMTFLCDAVGVPY